MRHRTLIEKIEEITVTQGILITLWITIFIIIIIILTK